MPHQIVTLAARVGGVVIALLVVMVPARAAEDLAPLDEALTLAQFGARNTIHTLAVLSVDDTHVSGVDVSAALGQYPNDPISLVRSVGLDALARAVRQRANGRLTKIRKELLLPVVSQKYNIAAGTNYAEHGEEANIDVPFIFPKISNPSPHQHTLVFNPDWLLDYEVELAVVFDRDIALPSDLDGAVAGFFVVNDFTERATLVRQADIDNPRAGAGFADAKGQPGFLPTGPWMVVPLGDWRDFYKKIALVTHVNGEERQRDVAASMIWDIDRVVAKTLETGGKGVWKHSGESVDLYTDKIASGTTILTGTPAGVLFLAPGAFYLGRQAARWAFTFSFRNEPFMGYVRERLITDQRKKGIFLKAGDEVVVRGAFLGEIRSQIVAE